MTVIVGKAGDDLLRGKPLPTAAELGMPEQCRLVRYAEQRMQKAAVADVDLGTPHEPLAEMLKPRWQEPDHEGRREHFEMAEYRLVGLAK